MKSKPCGPPELFAFQRAEYESVGNSPFLNQEAKQPQQE